MIRAVVLVTVIFGASVQALPVHGGEALYRGTFAATVSSVWGEALLDLGVSENSPLTGTFEIGILFVGIYSSCHLIIVIEYAFINGIAGFHSIIFCR